MGNGSQGLDSASFLCRHLYRDMTSDMINEIADYTLAQFELVFGRLCAEPYANSIRVIFASVREIR